MAGNGPRERSTFHVSNGGGEIVKTIAIRKLGTVRLTATSTHVYGCCCCVVRLR